MAPLLQGLSTVILLQWADNIVASLYQNCTNLAAHDIPILSINPLPLMRKHAYPILKLREKE